MDSTEIVGFVAGAFSSLASAPQLIKIIRERSAADVSTKTYLLMIAGAVLWITYGALRGSPALMLWNGVWLLNSAAVLVFKLRSSHGA